MSVSVVAFGSLLVRCFGAEFALVCHFTLLQYLHLTDSPRCGCTACIKWFMSKFKPRSGLIVSSVRHPLGGGPCLKAGLLPLCIAVKAGCPEKCHETDMSQCYIYISYQNQCCRSHQSLHKTFFGMAL